MLEHDACSARTEQSSHAPTALKKAHDGQTILFFNRDRVSVHRNVKCPFCGAVQTGEKDQENKTGGLREKRDHQDIDHCRYPDNTAAAVMLGELSGYWHGNDCADDEAD